MKAITSRLVVHLPIIAIVLFLSVVVYGLLATKPAHAATVEPGVCRATIVFDRSGSVGLSELNVLRAQTQRLFQVGGLYDNKIELAFWSFSSMLFSNSQTNYNAPFHDYVSSRGENTSFNDQLARIQSGGVTNYEQGLAYNNGVRNPYLNDIINKTDVIVFLSDGQPNAGTDRMRAAAQAHQAAGRIIVGGLIGTATGQPCRFFFGES